MALDVDSEEAVGQAVDSLSDYELNFKVGLELIHSIGTPTATGRVRQARGKSFVDGKLADIPTTLAKAMASLARQGATFVNVFAPTGTKSMEAVVKARDEAKCETKILAVTVLTTMDEAQCLEAYGCTVREGVIRFATMAKNAGCDGLVCSARDLGYLKEHGGFEGMETATPGIRSPHDPPDDQKRTMTPGDAIRAGATYLVIGRPILKPPAEVGSPSAAVALICADITLALAELEVGTTHRESHKESA
ncbi:MAG: orotidine-5'-phosphate decarboxylase [Candidatus Andersenbacteria bacterium]